MSPADHWRHPKVVDKPPRKMRECIDCETPFQVSGGRKRCISCAAKEYRAKDAEAYKRRKATS